MRREFTCQSDCVKNLQHTECGARLGLVNCRRKPFTPEQLEAIAHTVFAPTEVDRDVVESVRVNDGEILVPGLRKYAGYVYQMAQLNPKAKIFERCLVVTRTVPFLQKVRPLV